VRRAASPIAATASDGRRSGPVDSRVAVAQIFSSDPVGTACFDVSQSSSDGGGGGGGGPARAERRPPVAVVVDGAPGAP
jgi:hypothetical protein